MNQHAALPLSLEELGLYNLLVRIERHNGEVDPILRYSLEKKGLLVDHPAVPQLTHSGYVELHRLRDRIGTVGVDFEAPAP